MAGRVRPINAKNKKSKPAHLPTPAGNAGSIKKDVARPSADDAIKADQKKKFLEAFQDSDAIAWSASKIGRSADTIERWRKEDADFDMAVVESSRVFTDKLKMTASARAFKGADNLLMFLIKQRDPSFRDHINLDARHLHAGMVSGRVPAEVRDLLKGWSKDKLKKLAEGL